MIRVYVLVAVAGCADSSPSAFTDPPITVFGDGDSFHVDGPGYKLAFARSGVRMPDSLLINGDEMLAPDSCNREGKIGLAMFPAIDVIAGAHGDTIDSSVVATKGLQGPAVAQFTVHFDTSYQCDGTQHLVGDTIFTMFAGGRIVRKDTITPSNPLMATITGGCGCDSQADAFFFTSFWAFKPLGASNVDSFGQPAADSVDRGCTLYGSQAIGVAWPMGSMNTRVGVNEVASWVFDFVANDTMITTATQSVISAIQISNQHVGNAECRGLLDRLLDVDVVIGGKTVSTGEDGIYVDDDVHKNPVVIRPSGSAALPAGSAVRLNLGNATHANVVRSPDNGNEASVVQRVDDTHVIFVFRDQLDPGQTITIEPS